VRQISALFPVFSAEQDPNMNPKWLLVATFVGGAALSWGVYVPLVHLATTKIGSNMRAFLMVGVAYFLVAVLVPSLFIFVLKSDPTARPNVNWATGNLLWGLLAGISGAIGALCVIFATRDANALAGSYGPLLVAPLVFAGAPIINTIAQMTIFAHGQKLPAPSPQFYAGLCMAAVGMVMVMVYKPAAPTSPVGKGPAAAAPTAASGNAARP
jgi:hypothetical protein